MTSLWRERVYPRETSLWRERVYFIDEFMARKNLCVHRFDGKKGDVIDEFMARKGVSDDRIYDKNGFI